MLKTSQTVTAVYHEQLTAYHSKKQRYINTEKTVTILSMLPVIEHVVHNIPISFQNHALCTVAIIFKVYFYWINSGSTYPERLAVIT